MKRPANMENNSFNLPVEALMKLKTAFLFFLGISTLPSMAMGQTQYTYTCPDPSAFDWKEFIMENQGIQSTAWLGTPNSPPPPFTTGWPQIKSESSIQMLPQPAKMTFVIDLIKDHIVKCSYNTTSNQSVSIQLRIKEWKKCRKPVNGSTTCSN